MKQRQSGPADTIIVLDFETSGLSPDMGAIEFRMLYVPFATFEPTVDGQRYRCVRPGLYRYEAIDRTFTADLTLDDDGLVIDYPTLFHRIPI